jgi:hypothetical protein
MVAYIVTALYIRAELKNIEKDRFLTVTSELFGIWQSREFMEAQFWLLHTLEASTWEEFTGAHRGDAGEMAFHRVGSFYDRIGTLIRLDLINDREILSTMGAFAIAVWQKIEPLVKEARRIENSSMFDDYERMLPNCYECYVPALANEGTVRPFQTSQTAPPKHEKPKEAKRVSTAELNRRLDKHVPVTVLDVRQKSHIDADPRMLPGAVRIPPDEIVDRYRELPPDREVVAYCA